MFLLPPSPPTHKQDSSVNWQTPNDHVEPANRCPQAGENRINPLLKWERNVADMDKTPTKQSRSKNSPVPPTRNEENWHYSHYDGTEEENRVFHTRDVAQHC